MPIRDPGAAIVLAAGFLVLFIGGGARFAIGLTLRSVVEESPSLLARSTSVLARVRRQHTPVGVASAPCAG